MAKQSPPPLAACMLVCKSHYKLAGTIAANLCKKFSFTRLRYIPASIQHDKAARKLAIVSVKKSLKKLLTAYT